MAHLCSRSLLAALLGLSLSSGLAAHAQFLYPDGTVRNQFGGIQSGPDPAQRLPGLPSQDRHLDRNSGAIYDGTGLMQSGPNPARTLPGWGGDW